MVATAPTHLGCALLGLLARTPDTGYRLAARMRRPVGYFWSARHSQVYPELARMEGGGLVDHVVVDGAGPRPTKQYRITHAGREALRAWVCGDLEEQPVRDLETLRLWSVWTVDPLAARDLVGQVRERHRARLVAYERELASIEDLAACRDPGHPLFASRLTLTGGIIAARAAVAWAEWMLVELGDRP